MNTHEQPPDVIRKYFLNSVTNLSCDDEDSIRIINDEFGVTLIFPPVLIAEVSHKYKQIENTIRSKSTKYLHIDLSLVDCVNPVLFWTINLLYKHCVEAGVEYNIIDASPIITKSMFIFDKMVDEFMRQRH